MQKKSLPIILCTFVLTLCFVLTPSFSFASEPQESYANEGWNNELSITLSDACDWLSDTDDDMLLQFCLGAAGKTAPAGTVNELVREISTTDPSAMNIFTLSYDILNLTFSGYHAANVMGVDLVEQLTARVDFTASNLHPVAYALLALNSNPYEVPNIIKNSPQRLVERLLQYQNGDGGFRSSYLAADSSVMQTGLALAALAPHRDKKGVNSSIHRGLSYLTANQQSDGSFFENGLESSVATSKIIVALKALGISLNDARFVKNEETLIDVLLRYVRVDGGFSSILDENSNFSATENAILALASIKKNKSPYQMDTSLTESTYVEETPVVLEPAKETINWTIPFFFGLYILLLLMIVLFLIRSRFHPLSYWEEFAQTRAQEHHQKFPRPEPAYQEPPKETAE